jgi:hypothetical protein
MKLTLLNTGLVIEVPIGKELHGRDRIIEAFARKNAGRVPGDLTPLSATESGAQVSTSAGRNDRPEPVQPPMTLSSEAMTKAVFAEMEEDVIGPEVRAKLRRLVSRKANEAWNEDQKRRPGGRTAADHAKFQADIDAGVESAVRAYAALLLGNPTALRVGIAASRANPVNGV